MEEIIRIAGQAFVDILVAALNSKGEKAKDKIEKPTDIGGK